LVAIVAESELNVPRTFVINRTKLGLQATTLMMEMRRVMEPYTAASLKVGDEQHDKISLEQPSHARLANN
jgi:hypothetical protein